MRVAMSRWKGFSGNQTNQPLSFRFFCVDPAIFLVNMHTGSNLNTGVNGDIRNDIRNSIRRHEKIQKDSREGIVERTLLHCHGSLEHYKKKRKKLLHEGNTCRMIHMQLWRDSANFSFFFSYYTTRIIKTTTICMDMSMHLVYACWPRGGLS